LPLVQTVSIDATGGTFTLAFDVPGTDGVLIRKVTAPIAWNASAAAIRAALDPILNPNNAFDFLPHTDNVDVRRVGNVVFGAMQGAFARTPIAAIDTSKLVGAALRYDITITDQPGGGSYTVAFADGSVFPTPVTYASSANDTAASIATALAARIND